ncbi:MAG: TrkA family potassium uptake protein [Coriobacteriia bacterium]|nr:TrkA family potassium uptake protein [Coriobacteriia bacterium]
MHVVIGGFGRVGQHLVRALEAKEHTVAVIDRNPGAFANYGRQILGRELTGEVIDRETLIKAGIKRADVYAAVSSGDNSNIVSARIARERFGVERVVARIYDPRRADIYRHFGIAAISSVQWTTAEMIKLLLNLQDPEMIPIGDGIVLATQIEVPQGLGGSHISDIESEGRLLVSALVRGGKSMIPSAHIRLEQGDRLCVSGTREALSELDKLFGIERGQR